ncbi:MAG: DegV family protein [Lachnospiraceae bacterium]|nr:DegV family protein [Lachnospiraceae bacterium]
MPDYQIITDGSCDLGTEIAKQHDIHVVPFYVSFDGEKYQKELEEVSVRDFYQQMVDHPKLFPKSSLPSIEDYIEAFQVYAAKGIDIICICITTKFSGSYNSAWNAAELVREEYPSIRITVIDSTVDTVLQGIYVLEAARMRQNGLSYEETIARLEQIKSSGRIIFTIGSLDYLVAGGRIGKLLGLAGSTLGLKPLIILKEGEIFSGGITRSREKAKKKLLALTKEHFEKTGENPNDYLFVVGYGYDYQEAVSFRDELLASVQTYRTIDQIDIFQIGATIGVHTGPYPIGLGLLKRYDASI